MIALPTYHEPTPPARLAAPRRRIAIVHDFLYTYAGAERVLEQLIKLYPQAELFALFDFLPEELRGFIGHKTVRTTFIQRLPFASSRHRSYLPLMPLAIESLDLGEFDMVISSSYLVAKGILTRPDQLHICYCHTPARFAWDQQGRYLKQAGLSGGIKGLLARALLQYIRTWDVRTSNGVDRFVANSDFVARRVRKVYRREASRIYPPVAVEQFTPCSEKQDYYLTVSRLVPYKRTDLIVEAFSRLPGRQLVVIGDGPELARLRKTAGPNVTLLGHRPFDEVHEHLQRARAFVFAAEEDFGIAPVEAQACGTPVIAYGRGGAAETIISGKTGLFFPQQTVPSLTAAIEEFEACGNHWDSAAIREQALRFSAVRFRREFAELLEREWTAFTAPAIAASPMAAVVRPVSAS